MSRRRGLLALGSGLGAFVLGGVLVSGSASTFAGLADDATTQARATAGVWTPDPPSACGPVSSYSGGIQWGTPGDDVLYGGNRPEIIMGMDGNDTIYGGNSGDCLVGGAGNDRLIGGNGKDILIGGPGNDYLSGGNAKDGLDGGPDTDVCDGGNGKDVIVNCEYDSSTAPATQQLTQGLAPSGPSAEVAQPAPTTQQNAGEPGPATSQQASGSDLPGPRPDMTTPTPSPSPAATPPPATPQTTAPTTGQTTGTTAGPTSEPTATTP